MNIMDPELGDVPPHLRPDARRLFNALYEAGIPLGVVDVFDARPGVGFLWFPSFVLYFRRMPTGLIYTVGKEYYADGAWRTDLTDIPNRDDAIRALVVMLCQP